MTSNEAAYLQRRAEVATHLASRASHPRAAQAHYRMAQAYLDRLYPASGGETNGAWPN